MLSHLSMGQSQSTPSFIVSENPFGINALSFLNQSPSQLYTWTFGDGTSLTDSANVVVHEYLNPGTYTACLTVGPLNPNVPQLGHCETFTIQSTTSVAIDSTCMYNDCVFPGDANGDRVVNMYDLLPIGLAHGFSGYQRYNATTNFEGQAVANWRYSTIGGKDRKHADSDGNGTVNQHDVAAIYQHYSFEHDGSKKKDKGIGPVFKVVIDTAIIDPLTNKVHLQAGIELGDANLSVKDLYGIAFSLKYNPAFVDSNSVTVTYLNSFLGHKDSLLHLDVNRASHGRLDMGFSRKDLVATNGIGRIALISLTIEDDIMLQVPTQRKFGFEIAEYLAIDNFGKTIKFDTEDVEINLNPTLGIVNSPLFNAQIVLYPNPTTESFRVKLENAKGEFVVIYNELGQRILEQDIRRDSLVNVSKIEMGVYWVQITTDKGMVTKPLIIKR